MLRLIRRLALFFVVVVPVIAVAVANRHSAELILDPFSPKDPALSIHLPLFAYLFAALMAGLLIGGFATWISQGKWRKNSKKQTAEAARWRLEADQLKRQLEAGRDPALPSISARR